MTATTPRLLQGAAPLPPATDCLLPCAPATPAATPSSTSPSPSPAPSSCPSRPAAAFSSPPTATTATSFSSFPSPEETAVRGGAGGKGGAHAADMAVVEPREAAVLLPLSMVVVQLIVVGMLVLSKLALNDGMSPFVIIVYRNLIAAAAIAPFVPIFEREMWRKVNWSVGGLIFVNAAFGDVLAMGLYFYRLRTTSAAYSSIFLNLIPIATFLIALVIQSEKLALGNWPGKTMVLGVLLFVGGTMVVSPLKGRLLHLWPTNLLKSHARETLSPANPRHDMVVGTLWLCGSYLSYALYFIMQARLVKLFPSTYLMTVLTSLLGSMQAFVVGVFLVHDRAEWSLKWDLKLLTVIYSGVFNTGLGFLLITWVISRSYLAPLPSDVQFALSDPHHCLGLMLLGTDIYLASVLGTVLVILGLYAFLWGKAKELNFAAAAAAAQKEQRGGDVESS